jgi:ABC-type dipeptide/oligopeptide/nickel transport system permease subunit
MTFDEHGEKKDGADSGLEGDVMIPPPNQTAVFSTTGIGRSVATGAVLGVVGAAGSAVGFAIAGPVGAVAGGIVAGMIGGAIGGKVSSWSEIV